MRQRARELPVSPASQPLVRLWRRIDAPGMDVCSLTRTARGWRLEGTTVGRFGRSAGALDYRILASRNLACSRVVVQGWIGQRIVRLDARRTRAGWTLNGVAVPGLRGVTQADLGFSPSTNVLQVALLRARGESTLTQRVAWLDVERGRLSPLDHSYRVLGPRSLAYAAPRFRVRVRLALDDTGFVTRYPGLWRAVTR